MYRLKNMNFTHIKRVAARAFALIWLTALLCGCGEGGGAPAPFSKYFNMDVGGKPFEAQVAVDDFEKMRGLMDRRELGENSAMIFVYDQPQRVSFWMKDTLIPLDLALFTSDGTLREIKPLYPNNLNPVNSARADIKYCIETNAGWFEKNGIAIGAKLSTDKLEAAIKAREKK